MPVDVWVFKPSHPRAAQQILAIAGGQLGHLRRLGCEVTGLAAHPGNALAITYNAQNAGQLSMRAAALLILGLSPNSRLPIASVRRFNDLNSAQPFLGSLSAPRPSTEQLELVSLAKPKEPAAANDPTFFAVMKLSSALSQAQQDGIYQELVANQGGFDPYFQNLGWEKISVLQRPHAFILQLRRTNPEVNAGNAVTAFLQMQDALEGLTHAACNSTSNNAAFDAAVNAAVDAAPLNPLWCKKLLVSLVPYLDFEAAKTAAKGSAKEEEKDKYMAVFLEGFDIRATHSYEIGPSEGVLEITFGKEGETKSMATVLGWETDWSFSCCCKQPKDTTILKNPDKFSHHMLYAGPNEPTAVHVSVMEMDDCAKQFFTRLQKVLKCFTACFTVCSNTAALVPHPYAQAASLGLTLASSVTSIIAGATELITMFVDNDQEFQALIGVSPFGKDSDLLSQAANAVRELAAHLGALVDPALLASGVQQARYDTVVNSLGTLAIATDPNAVLACVTDAVAEANMAANDLVPSNADNAADRLKVDALHSRLFDAVATAAAVGATLAESIVEATRNAVTQAVHRGAAAEQDAVDAFDAIQPLAANAETEKKKALSRGSPKPKNTLVVQGRKDTADMAMSLPFKGFFYELKFSVAELEREAMRTVSVTVRHARFTDHVFHSVTPAGGCCCNIGFCCNCRKAAGEVIGGHCIADFWSAACCACGCISDCAHPRLLNGTWAVGATSAVQNTTFSQPLDHVDGAFLVHNREVYNGLVAAGAIPFKFNLAIADAPETAERSEQLADFLVNTGFEVANALEFVHNHYQALQRAELEEEQAAVAAEKQELTREKTRNGTKKTQVGEKVTELTTALTEAEAEVLAQAGIVQGLQVVPANETPQAAATRLQQLAAAQAELRDLQSKADKAQKQKEAAEATELSLTKEIEAATLRIDQDLTWKGEDLQFALDNLGTGLIGQTVKNYGTGKADLEAAARLSLQSLREIALETHPSTMSQVNYSELLELPDSDGHTISTVIRFIYGNRDQQSLGYTAADVLTRDNANWINTAVNAAVAHNAAAPAAPARGETAKVAGEKAGAAAAWGVLAAGAQTNGIFEVVLRGAIQAGAFAGVEAGEPAQNPDVRAREGATAAQDVARTILKSFKKRKGRGVSSVRIASVLRLPGTEPYVYTTDDPHESFMQIDVTTKKAQAA